MNTRSENKSGEEEEQPEDNGLNSENDKESLEPGIPADENTQAGEHQHRHGRRRRVKIKKRIRIKKKTSGKRKYRKLFERIIWVVFIAGFITALVVLLKQINISDDKYKAGRKRTSINYINPSLPDFTLTKKKQKRAATVNSI